MEKIRQNNSGEFFIIERKNLQKVLNFIKNKKLTDYPFGDYDTQQE